MQAFRRLGTAMSGVAEIQDPYEALLESSRRYRALAKLARSAFEGAIDELVALEQQRTPKGGKFIITVH